jgi:shikimate dehydrogenase
MKYYGLIGYPLSHSFSPEYFNKKFEELGIEAAYATYPLPEISDYPDLIINHQFAGLNVTIPYKEAIIPYLDVLDEEAAQIGAVNTIRFADGKTTGYNTDVYGFERSLLELIGHQDNVKGALVLGTGGASKAVCFVLRKFNMSYLTVSRTRGDLTYEEVNGGHVERYPLLINTTPLGMYPKEDSKPHFPYDTLTKNNFLYDLVYNPQKTLFLSEGYSKGSLVKNGLDMLVYQAERAYEIWIENSK